MFYLYIIFIREIKTYRMCTLYNEKPNTEMSLKEQSDPRDQMHLSLKVLKSRVAGVSSTY